jgi:hypothetical protein
LRLFVSRRPIDVAAPSGEFAGEGRDARAVGAKLRDLFGAGLADMTVVNN